MVECIAREKVFPVDVFHTEKHHQAGFMYQPQIWLIRWLSWPREDRLHHKSVFSSEISTVFLKLKVLLDLRFWEFLRLVESLHPSQRTCITWSRKPLTLESISRNIELIRTANSDWFLSNPESTDLHDTTEKFHLCHQPGDTNLRRPTPFFHE